MITTFGQPATGDFATAQRDLQRHIDYLRYRPRGPPGEDKRSFFNREESDRRDRDIHAAIDPHGDRAIRWHRISINPGPEERIDDWEEFGRRGMRDLEEILGQKLHWELVKHISPDGRPHLHGIVAGRDQDDARVFLDQNTYRTWSDHLRDNTGYGWDQALEREQARDQERENDPDGVEASARELERRFHEAFHRLEMEDWQRAEYERELFSGPAWEATLQQIELDEWRREVYYEELFSGPAWEKALHEVEMEELSREMYYEDLFSQPAWTEALREEQERTESEAFWREEYQTYLFSSPDAERIELDAEWREAYYQDLGLVDTFVHHDSLEDAAGFAWDELQIHDFRGLEPDGGPVGALEEPDDDGPLFAEIDDKPDPPMTSLPASL